MSHEIDLKNYEIRTDLALETLETMSKKGYRVVESREEDVKITTVMVNEIGSREIGKKPGTYVTLEFEDTTDHENQEKIIRIFSKKLKELLEELGIKKDATSFVIGLGNEKSTPDSLGPLTVNQILVTNHLFYYGEVESGYRPVSAFSPGVMGETGIETSDFIKSAVLTLKPDFLIVVDALASQSIERVNHTIQMSDTGIHPGSGVGNKRKEISKETLGIPVISIGVPTVVDAVTIVSDTMEYLYKHFAYTKETMDDPVSKLIPSGSVDYRKKEVKQNKEDKKKLLGMLGTLEPMEIKQLIFEVLTPIGYNFMVTPKEVDFVIQNLSEILGRGINQALHEKVQR